MVKTGKIIGAAGAGKTTCLLSTMEKVLETDIRDPHSIGFISFTRAARGEAANRAAARFGLSADTLERDGWFRTMHSTCYKLLKVGRDEMVTASTKEDRAWLEGAVGDTVARHYTSVDDAAELFGQDSDAGKALSLWSISRNKGERLADTWKRVAGADPKTPSLGYVTQKVENYEAAKRRDKRYDFTDLLLRFAGFKATLDGVGPWRKEGVVPDVPVWFADEWQDASWLQNAVFERLIEHSRWAYAVADVRQAIYQFSGSDPSIFRNWKADQTRVLPKTWRCGRAIWEFAENVARRSIDYEPYGVKSSDHEGMVQFADVSDLRKIDPRQNWLVIARTNFLCGKMKSILGDAGIPFGSVGDDRGPSKPTRGVLALRKLEAGGAITGDEWSLALEILPSRVGGVEVLTRGTKAEFEDKAYCKKFERITTAALEAAGGTETLKAKIRSGEWKFLLDKGVSEKACMMQLHGEDAILDPTIQVGTIHSVKGSEADNVFLLDAASRMSHEAASTPEGMAEELCCWYVGATRARQRLVVATDNRLRGFDLDRCADGVTSHFQGDEGLEEGPEELVEEKSQATWTF